MPVLRRDIHKAVEPDSVSEAMALTFRWCAVNSAAIAIDWSMRVNTRFRKCVSSGKSEDFSASTQMRDMASTVCTG
jgi:hypothetical protein